MKIRTINSIYSIKGTKERFEITKTKEINISNHVSIGETKFSKTAHIMVGYLAQFDDWRTSTVLEIIP